MARFASEAELETFLGRLDPDFGQYAPFKSLWACCSSRCLQQTNPFRPTTVIHSSRGQSDPAYPLPSFWLLAVPLGVTKRFSITKYGPGLDYDICLCQTPWIYSIASYLRFCFRKRDAEFLTFGVWDKITVVPTVTRTVGLRAPTAPRPGFYKFLPANTADRLCQSWQSCSNHHVI